MNDINKLRKQPPHTVLDQRFKHPNRLLLTNTQCESLPDLLDRLVRLSSDIWNVGIGHQCKEVQNQVARLSKGSKRRKTVLFEGGIVGRVGATHGVDHYLGELDRWRHGLWVAAEDVAEVDVEEVT